MTGHRKILIVAYSGHGHIIPSLRFAKRLLKMGVHVTYSTSLSVVRRMEKETTPPGLTFAPFSDGHDDGQQPNTTFQQFFTDFTTNGAAAVAKLIGSATAAGQPFDHVVYTTILPWVARVAAAHGIKSTLLWCQSTTIMDIYFYYFNGYQSLISGNNTNPTFPVNLPGLPSLTIADLPSFFSPSSPKELDFVLGFVKEHVDVLKLSPRILVNSFNELEIESVRAIEKLEFLPIGPFVPSELLDGKESIHNSSGQDDDYIRWLNTKPKSSVVYVSFGTLATLSMDQMEEIAVGLLESGYPFLWVIRDIGISEGLSKTEELKKQGRIVDWCNQVEVLCHEAIGCFVTHGGWNSTLEALVGGVRMVVFPQWSDQGTNGKMVEDVWRTGVRVRRREEDGMLEGKEIERCVKVVMGDEEMKKNAEKWRDLGREALNNGGSSTINLQTFLDGKESGLEAKGDRMKTFVSHTFRMSRYLQRVTYCLMICDLPYSNSTTPIAAMTGHRKILIVAYSGQGHVIPSLRFAKRLVKMGVHVTYSTSLSVIRRLDMQTTAHGLTFAPFSDGHDDGQQPNTTYQQFITDFATNGASAVAELISSATAAGQPFDHLVYTTVIPWASRVADAHGIKSTLLWCQSVRIMDIYYYYFNGYQSLISGNNTKPTFPVDLPGLPPLTIADMPSFFSPSNPKENAFVLESVNEHLDVLKLSPRILVNSFNELELESMRVIEKLEFLPIGPLVPSEFLGGKESINNSSGEDDYIRWLNTKPKSSVVYVSFGTLATLSMDQMEEIAVGLLESRWPFLWVIRDNGIVEGLSKIEELKKQGRIVDWCNQVEVLCHEAIGCFVMHGGWNSTLEALVGGVPMVVFPQWSDQTTNGKMVEDVWRTGVRVRKREGDGMVEGKEIERCMKIVMGDEEMKKNAEKWKDLAREALNDGGSSTINLRAFLDDI
ncbi:hypothetical protein OSB04_027971 [Centaurea solstitialis]|uniref:Uncharacterized protein n=1 Tax=Centaurea solstitialis TaxID=347529 RepID=A0AA38SSB1_9ASTR|nr:hypothetical protein OSB04_027971 [Centaurea solstitialis]